LGAGRRLPGTVTEVRVLGRGGVPVNAGTVALNVTAVNPLQRGFVTVYPCGELRPDASSINYMPGTAIANAVISKVGTGGRVCVYTHQNIDLVIDVNGAFPAGSSYAPLVPARLLDTRAGATTIDGQFLGAGRRLPGTVTEVRVLGRGGVPVNAGTVALNVTAVNPLQRGFVTVYPCGELRPDASSINYMPGTAIANAVISKVGTGGRVCVYTHQNIDLVIDVNGAFPAGSSYAPLVPARVLDTRAGATTIDGQFLGAGRRLPGTVTEVRVLGRGGVPVNAGTVALNVTAVNPLQRGFVTVYPCGELRPDASSINYMPGTAIANAVISKVGTGGRVCVYTHQNIDLVIDVNGAFK
jgi:hypothetical protein